MQVIKISGKNTVNLGRALEEAARVIRAGGLVAYPTESFYAIGADALDGEAVSRVFRAKGRRDDNPLPVIVHNMDALVAITDRLSEEAVSAVGKLAPGPVTFVLKAAGMVPDALTAGTGTIGVRIPDHGMLRELARLAGGPVTATSANLAGEPGLTDPEDVAGALAGSLDLLLDGGAAPGPPASTVLDLTVWPPVVLRDGRASAEEIRTALGIR